MKKENETKPFAFRASNDIAIEIKCAALRAGQTIETWCLDAAKIKLGLGNAASKRAT